MRHLIGSILAITIAGVAAVAATTALLNAPVRMAPSVDGASAALPGPAASVTQAPDAPPPKGSGAPDAPAPTGSAPAGTEPADGKATPEGANAEESDTDPYEGIAPEELPPDLQYDADASVSFPTNT